MKEIIVDLRPCPYCGGAAFIDIQMSSPYIDAHHTKNCIMRPNTWLLCHNSMKRQAKAWNAREEKK